ncbi:periplasmic heavy metal sensor [uncultured Desulfosarcina sp.]|uniref:periplasmic heavy metal sensor n=1 Tax=uncultured Desulfosarcina sp. TaxID=218289 RepID=UPI0029C969E6|nr:periplasmic heavy metal sensor [uncultured Desulfosarcina sp.]
MTLFQKRLLILFSVALNIGFVIMAIAMIINYPTSHRERPWRELVEIVQRLDLPESKEKTVLETMTRFRETMDNYDRDLKTARDDIIRLLAGSGPADLAELHRLFEAAQAKESQKSNIFETHVVDLRQQLGDEKGSKFFSLLLANFENHSDKHDR